MIHPPSGETHRLARTVSWRRAWLGGAIGLFALLLAVRGLNLPIVWSAIRQADYVWLIPGTLCYLGGIASRTWRWSYILRQVHPVGARDIFPILISGYAVNNIAPARAGELVRVYLLGQRFGIRWMTGLATITLERTLDGALLVILLVAVSTFPGFAAEKVPGSIGLWSGLVFGTSLLLLLGLLALARAAQRRGALITHLPAGIMRLISQFAAGLTCLRSRSHLLAVMALTCLVWGIEALTYWLVAHGFGLDDVPGFLVAAMAVASLATAIPSAPGHVGTFHLAGISTLRALGLSPEGSAGYMVVLHGLMWLTVVLLGVGCAVQLGLSWQKSSSVAHTGGNGW